MFLEDILEKAKIEYERGNLEKAEKCFLEALQIVPECNEAKIALSRCKELKEEPNVMILREKRFPGCGTKIPFYINNELKHKFKNGELIKFRLPAGRYIFKFSNEERCVYNVEIKNDYHIIEINCYNSLSGVYIETHERYMMHRYKDIF